MKRFFTFLLALTLTVSLTSCDGLLDDLLGGVEDFVGKLEGDEEGEEGGEDLPSVDNGEDDGEDDYVDQIIPNEPGPVVVKDWRIKTIFHLNVAQGDLEDDYADLEFHFDYDENNRLNEILLKNYSADNDIDSSFYASFEYATTKILCTITESVGGQANHRLAATREITAELDQWSNVLNIEDKRFDPDGELIAWEKEYLTYDHYGNTGRRLAKGDFYEWLVPHGETEADFFYTASYELNFALGSMAHHIWSGYPAYTNTSPEYYENEANLNKTNLDINWLLANCSRAMNYTARGLGGLHPFLLQGLCGDRSSDYLINELTSAPGNSRHLYYRYTYHYNSDMGDGYPIRVQRYVADDPSRDGNYTLESEFWIIYDSYEYVINPKE